MKRYVLSIILASVLGNMCYGMEWYNNDQFYNKKVKEWVGLFNCREKNLGMKKLMSDLIEGKEIKGSTVGFFNRACENIFDDVIKSQTLCEIKKIEEGALNAESMFSEEEKKSYFNGMWQNIRKKLASAVLKELDEEREKSQCGVCLDES